MVPGPTRTDAIIDTGAEMTVITPHVAEALLFDQPLRTVRLAAVASTASAQPVHPVRISVGPPGGMARPIDLSVVVASLVTARAGCLIGRDLLASGKLEWDGPASRWELVLPG